MFIVVLANAKILPDLPADLLVPAVLVHVPDVPLVLIFVVSVPAVSEGLMLDVSVTLRFWFCDSVQIPQSSVPVVPLHEILVPAVSDVLGSAVLVHVYEVLFTAVSEFPAGFCSCGS